MNLKSLKLTNSKCCYIYASKELKKAIEKHQEQLQKKHNAKYGKKAGSVSFSYASKDIVGRIKGKWF